MDAIKDTADEVAARFLADLRANTTRPMDQRADPAWHAIALVAFELFGESAGKSVIMASRLAARSPPEIAADHAEIAEVIKSLGDGAASPA